MTISNTFLTTSVGPICTSPSVTTVVTSMYFCNLGDTQATFTVYAVPYGQAVSPIHTIYENIQLAPHDTYIVESEKLMLDYGDSVCAVASTDNEITATVSFMDM